MNLKQSLPKNMTKHPARFLQSFFLSAVPLLLAGAAHAFDHGSSGSATRVLLGQRTFDARDPAKADFLDCPEGGGPCEAVAIPRVVADEKVTLPRNKPLESLRFLTLKGLRAQGGDPILTLALYNLPTGDSVYVDLNNDEDLGNDGPGRFLAKGDSCVTLERAGGGSSPVSVCRTTAKAKAKAWQAKCEGMKTTLTWANCDEPPFRVRLLDMSVGSLSQGGKDRRIALCDADGDGKIRLDGGDRLVVDWDGDGVLEKSLDADGIAGSGGDAPLRFSLDSTTYEIASVDERGAWLEVRRLYTYDPAAAGFKAVEGRKAPDIRFVNLDGDTLRLSSFKGKKVMVHFWSTLCKPCLEDLSGIRDFHKGFADKNWVILSLTTDSDLGQVQQAALKYRMEWMVGMAGPEARRYYATRPLPLTVKINAEGILEKKDIILGKRAF